MPQLNELLPTRRSLLSRLKNWKDEESWREFFDTYWKLIYNAAVRAGLNATEAQDVVQETVIAVSRNMPNFVYDPAKGSFKAWLMRQTSWRIGNQFRKRLPVHDLHRDLASQATTALERVPDPAGPALDALWDEEWEKVIWEAALRRVKRKVDAKQYQVFDLCVHRHWPAGKVAKDLRINAAKVYLIKHRVGNLLKRELLYLKTKPL